MNLKTVQNIVKFNHIYVVGAFLNNKGYDYSVLEIKKKNNKINILNFSSISSEEDLNKLNKKIPVILSIDGKGVIYKKVNLHDEGDIKWNKNINYDTIHYTSLSVESNIFFSICKKEVVESLIKQFQVQGFEILDAYPGGFFSYLLYPHLSHHILLSNGIQLIFENGVLIDFIKHEIIPEEKYEIDNLELSNFFLPLYGLAIHFFLPQEEIRASKSEQINREAIVYKRLFTYYGIGVLIFFLGTLLLSYGVIQYYGAKNYELNQQSVYTAKTYRLIIELEEEKNNKLKLLSEVGILSDKFLSQYAYEIAGSIIDQDIVLEKMSVFPKEGDFKQEKKITIHSHNIIIGGSVSEKEVLNTWIEMLGQQQWVNSISILSLNGSKSGRLLFELNVTIK